MHWFITFWVCLVLCAFELSNVVALFLLPIQRLPSMKFLLFIALPWIILARCGRKKILQSFMWLEQQFLVNPFAHFTYFMWTTLCKWKILLFHPISCLGINVAFCRETSVHFVDKWCLHTVYSASFQVCSSLITKTEWKVWLWKRLLILVMDILSV